MGTYIHGVAASQALDTAGEILDINGLDISSLVGSVFNFEHESKLPSQIVGKILEAKKILDESDCENDNQLEFWNKSKIPFLYVLGELFDNYKESAKEIAGLFRYDLDNKDKQTPTLGFSIEGAKLKKDGAVITHSIARKVTITQNPANKMCEAEMIPGEKEEDSDDIFKTEPTGEVELFKSDEKSDLFKLLDKKENPEEHAKILGIDPMKKAELSTAAIKVNPGSLMGRTSSGKEVFSHAKIHEYPNFSSQEHREASEMHHQAAGNSKNGIAGSHHFEKMKLHLQAANTAKLKEDRAQTGMNQAKQKAIGLNKALEAGSGMAAPSQLVGGAALSSESLDKKPKKSVWLKRAEEQYDKWEKKEEFRSFMSKRLPKLARGEIDAIGATLLLSKSIKK